MNAMVAGLDARHAIRRLSIRLWSHDCGFGCWPTRLVKSLAAGTLVLCRPS